MKSKKLEIGYYVSVGAGLALSTTSFLLISGLFEISNYVGVFLSCILAGLVCILISFGVGEMASKFPSAPGIRTYIKHALGERVSLFCIYLYILVLVLVAGAESYVFALVVNNVFPNINPIFIILIVLGLVIGINLKGLEFPRIIQMVMTFVLLSGVIIMGIIGIVSNYDNPVPQESFHQLLSDGINHLPTLIGMAVFLFIGFEWVTPLGISPSSYKKRVPYSMPAAILLNIIVYTIFTIGIGLTMLPSEIVASSIPQMSYIRIISGDTGKYFAAFLSVLAILSTFNAENNQHLPEYF